MPLTEFSADAMVYVSDSLQSRSELQAQVVSTARGVLCVTLTNLPRVSGLCCKWGEEFEMSYKELSLIGDAQYLPDFSFQRVLYDVLINLWDSPFCTGFEQGVATFEGKVAAGEYRAITDEKGYIQQISVKEINLSIEFTYKNKDSG